MPTRHPTAQALLIGSYIVALVFLADVLAGGFPNSVPVRAFKQSLGA